MNLNLLKKLNLSNNFTDFLSFYMFDMFIILEINRDPIYVNKAEQHLNLLILTRGSVEKGYDTE